MRILLWNWRDAISLALVAVMTGGWTGQAISGDEKSAEDITQRLLAQGGPSADEVHIRVSRGVATLSGTVDTLLTQKRAVALSLTRSGIRGVVDLMGLDPVRRKDHDIRSDIEASLAADPAIIFRPIKVASIDGYVTLNGTVASVAEKDLAAISASGVKGVRHVNDWIDVVPPKRRSAYAIRTDIEQRLKWDPWLGGRAIGVRISGGAVTLTGHVSSAWERRRLSQLADVVAVTRIENRTKIAGPLPGERRDVGPLSDAALVAEIRTVIAQDPRLSGARPQISVSAAQVTLSGILPSYGAQRAALADAKNSAGVAGVIDHIVIASRGRFNDDQIRDNAKRALSRDPDLSLDNVTVSIRHGDVLLRGVVPSFDQQRKAADIVRAARGVRTVRNELTVLRDIRNAPST